MGAFIVFCVIGIIFLFGWMLFGESDDNKKSSSTVQNTKNENQEQYVKYAVTAIEKAYKIATVYPPMFLKGRICRVIRFKNTANEEITCNPTYRVAVLYNGKSTYEDVITFSNDENKKKYYGGWTFSFSDNEIFDEYPTYDITWLQLKNRVIFELEKRHPEWKVSDLETYVSISF